MQAFYATEMKHRASRPLGVARTARVEAFTERLRAMDSQAVVEVGCGAGRDGLIVRRGVSAYTGVDVSPAAVRTCRDRGLTPVQGSATHLPFDDDSFDGAWSMSTLMHLPGEGFAMALGEIARVVRTGGTVEIGVWGHTRSREWTKPEGRYFNHRTDEQFQRDLHSVGTVVDFDTWDWFEDGGHYQWARVKVR